MLARFAFVVLLLLGTVPGTAAGADPFLGSTSGVTQQYPELTGPGVVTYDVTQLVPIKNSKRILVLGTPQADAGCVFKYETPMVRQGDPVPAARLLALDPATCRALVEQGELDGPPPVSSGRDAPVPAAPAGAVGTTEEAISPDVPGWQYSYEYSTRWWDPIGIKVHEARPYVLWDSNGSTITDCAGNTSGWWNTATGWYQASKSISVYYGSGYTTCTSDAYVNYRNNVFNVPGVCLPPTNTYYNRVGITARANGSRSGFVTTWSTGQCSFLLHWDTYGPYAI